MTQRIRTATVRRALFAAFLLTIAIFSAVAVPPSEAAPAGSCTYYSDASKTVVVGRYGYDCCNNYIAQGIKTSYYTCGGCFICFPPPPQ